MTAPRPAALGLLFLALLLTVHGCASAGRSVGRGAVDGVRERRETLALVPGPFVDSFVYRTARSFRDSLRPELQSMVTGTTDSALGLLDLRMARLRGGFSSYFAGELRDSMQALITGNMGVLRESLRESIELWVGEAGGTLDRSLGPAAGRAADTAVAHATATLDAALNGPLRGTLLRIVGELGDSLRQTAGNIARDPSLGDSFKRLLRQAGAKILVPLGLVVVGCIGFAYWTFRKRQRMLEVITSAIRSRGTEDLKETIKERAEKNGVEKDLNRFLVKRNIL